MLKCMDIIIIMVAHNGHAANLFFQFNFCLKRFMNFKKLKIINLFVTGARQCLNIMDLQT